MLPLFVVVVVVVGDKNWRVVMELREECEYEKKVVHESVKTKFTIGRESQSSFLQRLFSIGIGNPHPIFPISLYFFCHFNGYFHLCSRKKLFKY